MKNMTAYLLIAFGLGCIWESNLAAQTISVDASSKPTKRKSTKTKPTEPPQPKALIETPRGAAEPTFLAKGGFETTKQKALDSALLIATEKFGDYLRGLDDPVNRNPTPDIIRKMLVKHPAVSLSDGEGVKIDEMKIDSSAIDRDNDIMYQVELAVKVEPGDIRAMRSRERASGTFWMLGGIGGLIVVLAIFFKIDAWTKGYLTTWLFLGSVGIASLIAGLMWWSNK